MDVTARIIAFAIALCLVGSVVQAADLPAVDDAADIVSASVLDGMDVANDAVIRPPTTIPAIARVLVLAVHARTVLDPRLHVSDAFRPPEP